MNRYSVVSYNIVGCSRSKSTKGLICMDVKTIVKGVSAGAAVGLAYCAVSSASAIKKHSIKRDASRTMHAAESLIRDIKSVLS